MFLMTGCNKFNKHVKIVDGKPTLDDASVKEALKDYLAAIALFMNCIKNLIIFTPAQHTWDNDKGPGGSR